VTTVTSQGSAAAFMDSAPVKDSDYFKVPRVVDKG